jgi:hypothetical protein
MVITRLFIFIGVLGFLAHPTDPAQYLVERLVSTPDRKKGERQTTKPHKDGFLQSSMKLSHTDGQTSRTPACAIVHPEITSKHDIFVD